MSVTQLLALYRIYIHIYHLIIDKKYMLSYVYWDHTNTSQGYIDIRFFSLLFFFPSFLHGRHQASRDFLRSYEIPRLLGLFSVFNSAVASLDTKKKVFLNKLKMWLGWLSCHFSRNINLLTHPAIPLPN